MDKQKNNSIRSYIMENIKHNFENSPIWQKSESDLAVLCSDIPEPTNNEKKAILINQLKKLKNFLMDKGISKEELNFLDEEISLNQDTETMKIYKEKDDVVDDSAIISYARLGKGNEGVVSISQKYNYEQLIKLTNGVFKRTGLVKFYLSREKEVYGKIIAEFYEHAQEITIASVVESFKNDKETGEPLFKGVKLFGQKISNKEMKILREIDIPFYVYRFITDKNVDLILLSLKKYEIGDYILTGVQTQCKDMKVLSDSARLPTKLPFFFAQKINSRIIKYKNHEGFKIKLDKLNLKKEDLFDFPFTVHKNLKNYKLLQPKWYKWFIWSWLTHQNKGMFNTYPMHILQLGLKQSGKSLMLNSLHLRSKEAREIFSGASSTIKYLVPSFKYQPARLGYLAESNRFSYCDEFLRCLINSKTTKEGSQREEGVALMNDLLEHQKREAGSGVSRVKVNMTSRILAMTNPIRGVKNVDGLIKQFDESFLSRWLIYYQTEDHVNLIRKSQDHLLEELKFNLSTNDWISIIDYLQSFSAIYDSKKIMEIYNSIPEILSENLKKHYDARHMHHINCLMDGVVKTRCFIERDCSFEANEGDYLILKEIWINIIKSWIGQMDIKKAKISDRIYFLPEDCQYLFWKVQNSKIEYSLKDLMEIALNDMSKNRFHEVYSILNEMELFKEIEGKIIPYCKNYRFKEFNGDS